MAETRVQPPRKTRLWPLYLGGSLGPFGGGVINIILPELAEELHTNVGVAAMGMTAYLIPLCLLLLPSGTLGARWGLVRTARWAFISYALASTLCVATSSIYPFLVGRALQGAANAFTTPLLIAIILTRVAENERGRALGTYAAIQAAGYAFAPLAGGASVLISYRVAFIISAVAALIFAASLSREQTEHRRQAVNPRFRDVLNWRLVGASTVAVCGQFIGTLIVLLTGLAAATRFGFSPVERGWIVAGFGAAGLLAGRLMGRMADRYGVRRLGPLTYLLFGVSAIVTLWAPDAFLLIATVWGGGLANTGARIVVTSLAVTSSPQNESGATSVSMSAQFLGSAVAPFLLPLYPHRPALLFIAIGAAAIVGCLLAYVGSRWLRQPTLTTAKEMACQK